MGVAEIITRKPYQREEGRIVYSTQTPGVATIAKEIREREKAALGKTQEDVMSVALSQPHRRGFPRDAAEAAKAGSEASRLSEPLGRLCARHRLREELWHAGCDYAVIVRNAKSAMGFDVAGLMPAEWPGPPLTDAQLDAVKELALQRLDNANAALRRVIERLPRVMERICFDQLEPYPNDEAIIGHGLLVLADLFRLLERGINAEKGI